MKTLQLIFLLLICFAFCSFGLAQSKPVALKFDEFDDSVDSFYPYEGTNLSQRIERFIKQIKQERGVKVYLICYRARKTNSYDYKCNRWNYSTKSEILGKTKLKSEDIISIDGGYRERSTIEYWIVPKNASSPKPTPSFDKSEAFECPIISVYNVGFPFDPSRTIDFSVSSHYLDKIENLKFEWKVTSGTIVEGQGTERIKVQLNDNDSKRVTAFIEVSGLPHPCEKVGYTTIEFNNKPYLIVSDENYNYSELSARVDDFMTQLNSNPQLGGYIIVYASRRVGPQEMERAIASVKRIFAFRKYDLTRVAIVRGGYRENNTVDMWVLPEGAENPIPTPTVDEKFVGFSKKKKTVGKKR
jgi:hypothetical protein